MREEAEVGGEEEQKKTPGEARTGRKRKPALHSQLSLLKPRAGREPGLHL